PFTRRTPRIVAAARLRRRRDRDRTGRFLVEGPQAVREALAASGDAGGERVVGPGAPVVRELFATRAAVERHADLVAAADRAGVPVSLVTEDAVAALAETVTPQGLVAVCEQR